MQSLERDTAGPRPLGPGHPGPLVCMQGGCAGMGCRACTLRGVSGPLGRPQRGCWMAGGAPCAEPGPRGPQDRLSWSVPPHPRPQAQIPPGRCKGNAEFPGRTQGSERNHRAGRAPPGSLLPCGAQPCGPHAVSVWGWGPGPAPPALLAQLWAFKAEASCPAGPSPSSTPHPRSHWAAGRRGREGGGKRPLVLEETGSCAG